FCGCPRSVTSHGVPRQPEKPGNTASFGCLHVFGRSDLPPCRVCPPGGVEGSVGRVVHRPSVQIAEPVHHGRCVLTPSLGVAVITTFFPADLTLARLKRLAQEHARQLDLDSSHVPPVRSMVNYLRHECTDYDLEQSASRHRAACEAIARRFPQLAKECRRQIARRTEQDLQEERAHQMWVAEEERLRAEHRAMVARSREVIKGMRVGQRVGFWSGGYWRTGVITKLGRSRVTVAYR